MTIVTTFSISQAALAQLIPDFAIYAGDKSWVRTQVRSLIVEMMLSGREPTEWLSPADLEGVTDGIYVNVSIPQPAGAMLAARAKEKSLTAGPFLKLYLSSMANSAPALPELAAEENSRPNAEFEETQLGNILAALNKTANGFSRRPEQSTFYRQLMDSLENGKVGLNEAGTGTGKTIAMLAAASEMVQKNRLSVLIAVPTVALISQFANTHKRIQDAYSLPPIRCIMGRREFVSKQELVSFLSSSKKVNPDVLKWIEDGGPAQANSGLSISWTIEALRAIDDSIPGNEVCIRDLVDVSDPGYLAYRSQFEKSGPAQIIVCTHAMLARDIVRRMNIAFQNEEYKEVDNAIKSLCSTFKSGHRSPEDAELIATEEACRGRLFALLTDDHAVLPSYSYLLVDECHQLEQNVSTALSDYVSLKGFLRKLSHFKQVGGKISQRSIDDAATAIESIRHIGGSADGELMPISGLHPTSLKLKSILNNLTAGITLPNKISADAGKEYAYLLGSLKKDLALLKMVSSTNSSTGYISYSPIRYFPQVYIGRSSVEFILRKLWEFQAGAAAISATIYLKKNGVFSASYMRTILSIPPNRAQEYTPVLPSFLFKPVTGLFMPATHMRDDRIWLRPPSRMDRMESKSQESCEQTWLDEVAVSVKQIYASAAGGVMVAMTSYANARELRHRLPKDQSVIVASPDMSLERQKRLYLASYHAGEKPIWIALGGAWTGLDVGGHEPYAALFGQQLPANEDNVLTDLIIPKIPYGLNMTLTHQYRIQTKPSIPWELFEAQFKLRQVVGRLVRREHLPKNRRIWLLDGRMNDPSFNGHSSAIKSLFSIYKQSVFEPEV